MGGVGRVLENSNIFFFFFEPFPKGRLQKKINGKENDIVQKGGGVSEKYQIMNVLLKSDILPGEGG